MRRKDRQQSREFALAVADKCEWAALAMQDEQGLPYCVPLSIVREGEDIYFHCAKSGRKTDCLRRRPEVCLVCVGDTCRGAGGEFTTAYESAIIRGEAHEVLDAAEKERALRLLSERHTPRLMAGFAEVCAANLGRTAVWRVRIREISGKKR